MAAIASVLEAPSLLRSSASAERPTLLTGRRVRCSRLPSFACRKVSQGRACRVRAEAERSSSATSATAAVEAKTESAAAVDTYSEEFGLDWEEVPVHTVTVRDRQKGTTYQVEVPQDQYILHTAEEQGIRLPFACRHGCCTACAVRVTSGELVQPRALGISPELKAKGYALLCVSVPLTDLECETQDEDEVYYQQFGKYFARGAIEKDDYALELALQDE